MTDAMSDERLREILDEDWRYGCTSEATLSIMVRVRDESRALAIAEAAGIADVEAERHNIEGGDIMFINQARRIAQAIRASAGKEAAPNKEEIQSSVGREWPNEETEFARNWQTLHAKRPTPKDPGGRPDSGCYYCDHDFHRHQLGKEGKSFHETLSGRVDCTRKDPPQPPTLGAAQKETGWVIEHGASEVSRPRYYGGVHGWTYDNALAVRFCREIDAQSVAEAGDDGVPNNYRLADRAWIGPPSPIPPQRSGTDQAQPDQKESSGCKWCDAGHNLYIPEDSATHFDWTGVRVACTKPAQPDRTKCNCIQIMVEALRELKRGAIFSTPVIANDLMDLAAILERKLKGE